MCDGYRDQFRETGHQERPGDLDEIAKLGIRTLRYPVLWESVSPDDPGQVDFSWHDSRLARLRELGIEPIIGLLHHGSGPRYTNLLDPAFPALFAQHAARVAERYPYLRAFTPVNEPLTTARFSGLYGVWYPHKTDIRSFARAFINQCLATVSAMEAIRSVIPDAKLVQTEDLGKTFSSKLLQYQADYENERRWLTFDLLFGRLTPRHSWYPILQDYGIREYELQDIADRACPPDVIGINHYLTSERFLEDREDRWPAGHPVGGNGRHRYADLEAIRMDLPEEALGLEARLMEVWERYQTAIAVTEVHHGCSRDEQLRWLMEAWQAASQLREKGVAIKAVTIWSMFGAIDWNSLLQIDQGCYEPGSFDIRAEKPRSTALATAARALATEGRFDHPVLDTAGWWRRADRFYWPPPRALNKTAPARRLILMAGEGPYRLALEGVLRHRGLDFEPVCCAELDMTDMLSAGRMLDERRAWAIIRSPSVQSKVPQAAILAAAASRGLPVLTFTVASLSSQTRTDLHVTAREQVWDHGSLDATGPNLVISVNRPFSVWERENLLFQILEHVRRGETIEFCAMTSASAAYMPDVFHAGLDLLIDGVRGSCCLENVSDKSWFDFARWFAASAGLEEDLIARTDLSAALKSPSLSPAIHRLMPSLDDAAGRYLSSLNACACTR
ncbi:dTDP-4-dehydrorhamnose reductase [Pseudorhizobium tarimense]|uniref:dTDP-4-dehydrorhamnose reductase n=1 Tax=Pseudorhizobium tarimense TaxID=1079109 RepID=A0ABV2H522_9HYPH|nr:family 1 glycosylhydrolase [Pseudorhizobium tarimense]MCJ8518859.1 family 1 glycosylhydrolase [Pseudorhizobium tarimense]